MKKLILIGGLCVSLLLIFSACGGDGASSGSSNAKLATEKDSMSYAIGTFLSQNMKVQGITLNADMLQQGFVDQGKGQGLTPEESKKLIDQFQMEMMMKQRDPASKDKPFSFSIDSVSLAIGYDFSSQMETMGMKLDGTQFGAGSRDFNGGNAALDSLTIKGQVDKFTAQMQAKATEKAAIESKANQAAGIAFLAENAKVEGVKTTASGLQYMVLKKGNGKKPNATDQVEVHYEGKLLDGTIFDSSVQRGETISFGLDQVIPGWTEGVQLMGVGSKYRFWIPGNLAYGERGSQPNIGPNATLVFEVELFSIGEKKK